MLYHAAPSNTTHKHKTRLLAPAAGQLGQHLMKEPAALPREPFVRGAAARHGSCSLWPAVELRFMVWALRLSVAAGHVGVCACASDRKAQANHHMHDAIDSSPQTIESQNAGQRLPIHTDGPTGIDRQVLLRVTHITLVTRTDTSVATTQARLLIIHAPRQPTTVTMGHLGYALLGSRTLPIKATLDRISAWSIDFMGRFICGYLLQGSLNGPSPHAVPPHCIPSFHAPPTPAAFCDDPNEAG